MSTDSVQNEDAKSTNLPAAVTDDSCTVKYIEVVPLTEILMVPVQQNVTVEIVLLESNKNT